MNRDDMVNGMQKWIEEEAGTLLTGPNGLWGKVGAGLKRIWLRHGPTINCRVVLTIIQLLAIISLMLCKSCEVILSAAQAC
jgi:hypothetical protein